MKGLTAGKLARMAEVNRETIRYYEKRFLLPKPSWNGSGYREFPLEAVQVIRFIKNAQGLGFSLKEIKELLSLSTDKGSTCGDIKKTAQRKLLEINEKTSQLKSMQKVLTKLIRACPSEGSLSRCSILEGFKE